MNCSPSSPNTYFCVAVRVGVFRLQLKFSTVSDTNIGELAMAHHDLIFRVSLCTIYKLVSNNTNGPLLVCGSRVLSSTRLSGTATVAIAIVRRARLNSIAKRKTLAKSKHTQS